MTENIKKEISRARLANRIAVGCFGSLCLLASLVGAAGLASKGLEGPVLIVLLGAGFNLWMTQRALNNLVIITQVEQQINEILKEFPDLTEIELFRKVLEKQAEDKQR